VDDVDVVELRGEPRALLEGHVLDIGRGGRGWMLV
jgi:hypothetical protein